MDQSNPWINLIHVQYQFVLLFIAIVSVPAESAVKCKNNQLSGRDFRE